MILNDSSLMTAARARRSSLLGRVGVVAAIGLLMTTVGCSRSDRPPLGDVSGTILLDGAPANNLIILFMPEEGRPAAATIGPDGTYSLEYSHGVTGAKVGINKVSFEWPTGEAGAPIPDKYGRQSELTFEVKPGHNNFDFKLESDKSSKNRAPVE